MNSLRLILMWMIQKIIIPSCLLLFLLVPFGMFSIPISSDYCIWLAITTWTYYLFSYKGTVSPDYMEKMSLIKASLSCLKSLMLTNLASGLWFWVLLGLNPLKSSVFLYGVGLSMVGTALVQLGLLQLLLLPLFSRKKMRYLIVGALPISARLVERFNRSRWMNTEFVGYLEDRAHDRLDSRIEIDKIIGRVSDICQIAEENRVDRIFISISPRYMQRFQEVFKQAQNTTASIYLVHDMEGFTPIQEKIQVVGGITTFGICESPIFGLSQIQKEVFDRITSLVALTMLSPLFLCIGAAIKLSSPGPVFFKQKRYGLSGESIDVYKFRSMRQDNSSPKDIVKQAVRNDPRVTRIGAFLRKSSLDELPQLINVLKGEMSLVGPRPHAVQHNEYYRGCINSYMVRHKVKPGITGLAQINGCRGETDTLDKMQSRVWFDLEYMRNWNFSLDLWIIIRTVKQVFGHSHAY